MMLRFEKAAYSYENVHEALCGLTCAINEGERVALVGPNGAGKSTALWLAAGAMAPSSGLVEVGGVKVTTKSLREVRAKASLAFSDPDDQLFCPMVIDEVAYALRNKGHGEEHCLARAHRSLEQVGLGAHASREPLSLSLGEKRALSVAAALAAETPLILLDEPTSNLDPRARQRMISLIEALSATVVFATHDLDAALELGARVLLVYEGSLVRDGTAEEVLTDESLLEQHGLALPLRLQGRVLRQTAVREET